MIFVIGFFLVNLMIIVSAKLKNNTRRRGKNNHKQQYYTLWNKKIMPYALQLPCFRENKTAPALICADAVFPNTLSNANAVLMAWLAG